MAVFYKWIKGCNSGADLTNGQWTYLTWSKPETGDVSTKVDSLPHLYVSHGRKSDISGDDVNDLGYILTSNVEDVEIKQDWVFEPDKMLFFGSKNISDTPSKRREEKNCFVYDSSEEKFYLFTRDWTINDTGNDTSGDGSGLYATALHIHGKAGSSPKVEFGANYPVDIRSDLTVNGTTTLNDTLDVVGETTLTTLKVTGTGETSINTDGGIHAAGKCQASYFNATSDIRAKEDIQPATYNALNLINKLPVYVYRYKNNPERMTGIMAQDLLQHQPKELDLVSNTNATGENGDYMSIKNDKLMFVLMKAIQEQQQQINNLKAEIERLKQA